MSEYIYPPPKSLPPGSVVIAYLRDSGGPKQDLSIGQQERVILDYCKKYSLILHKVYSETASGRKTKKRDQFLQMVRDVMAAHEDLRPDGLLLWAFSRFSRDYAQFNRYYYTLVDFGVVVHSLSDEEIPEGLAGGVVLSVKAYSNADYSRQLGKSIKRAIADNVRAGFSNGGQPPRGYRAIREDQESVRVNGQKRTRIKWEPDPELAPLVVLAWEMRAQGKGYGAITKATGGKIYKNKSSWGSHFRNKSYLGIGKAGDLEVPDHHTPIITWELWDAVKKVEKTMPTYGGRAALTHPRRIKHPSLLSGLSFCIFCGSAMVLHTAPDYRCYQCGKRDRQRGYKDCTQARSVNARKADRVILDAILNKILSPSSIELAIDEIQNNMTDANQIDQEIGRVNNMLVSTERSITRLVSLAEETGDIKDIAKRLNDLKQEKDEFNAQMRRLKAERSVGVPEITPEALSAYFELIKTQISSAIQREELLTAKKLIAQFVSKIELAKDKAVIHYAFPLGIPSDSGRLLSAHITL